MKQYFLPDTWVYIASAISLVAVFFVGKSLLNYDGMLHKTICVVITLGMLLLLIRMPIGVSVEPDSIKVQRLIGSTKLTNITSVTPIEKKDLSGAIRTFGNGGLFGYTGYYSSPQIGKFQMIAINMKPEQLALVVLDNGKKYVINYPQNIGTH